jgi:hypothetical protein
MTSGLDPLLVYYGKKQGSNKPFMTYSLHSDKNPVNIDPKTGFVVQNYQSNIMGYIRPQDLKIANVTIKYMGEFWLIIVLSSLCVWAVVMISIIYIQEKCCSDKKLKDNKTKEIK